MELDYNCTTNFDEFYLNKSQRHELKEVNKYFDLLKKHSLDRLRINYNGL